MIIIHLGLPKTGSTSLQKLFSEVNSSQSIYSSLAYLGESNIKLSKESRLIYFLIYRLVNDNDVDFDMLSKNLLPTFNYYLDNILSKTQRPLFISQESLSSTWRVDREKIIDRLEICFGRFNRKYILVQREPNKLIKSLYKMRVRDHSTKLPFHLWKLRHYFTKHKLNEFKNFQNYQNYIMNNIDNSKASLEILNFENVFKKPYTDLRRFIDILEMEAPFEDIVKSLGYENKSEKDTINSAIFQKLLMKTANF
tara:strand:- start:17 stop:775 length:759 start_codon:yes stop_codon:yes gene_type:complete